MTEYEAYDTVMSIAGNTYNLMFGYFSLVFAFLVMSLHDCQRSWLWS